MKWMMVVMLMAGLSGCHWLDQTRVTGTGAVVERQQTLGDGVTRVLAGVPATLYLVAGEPRGILIKGQENLLPYLELTESGDKLEIEVKEGYRLDPTEPLELTITLPVLNELALAGTGNGDLSGFKGDELVLSVAGTGDIVASQPAGAETAGRQYRWHRQSGAGQRFGTGHRAEHCRCRRCARQRNAWQRGRGQYRRQR
jgi:hypothetical protein